MLLRRARPARRGDHLESMVRRGSRRSRPVATPSNSHLRRRGMPTRPKIRRSWRPASGERHRTDGVDDSQPPALGWPGRRVGLCRTGQLRRSPPPLEIARIAGSSPCRSRTKIAPTDLGPPFRNSYGAPRCEVDAPVVVHRQVRSTAWREVPSRPFAHGSARRSQPLDPVACPVAKLTPASQTTRVSRHAPDGGLEIGRGNGGRTSGCSNHAVHRSARLDQVAGQRVAIGRRGSANAGADLPAGRTRRGAGGC